MNIIYKLLRKTGIFSIDLFYILYFMLTISSHLYYRHKLTEFKSCVFCQNLSYDKNIKKYACSCRHYTACNSLLPCIIPESSLLGRNSEAFIEEKEYIPWLFKAPCLNFKALPSNLYFRNFISIDFNKSIIQLEALQGILTGNCSDSIPCHICAAVNKDAYTKCRYIQKASEIGKCCIIYDNINECFAKANNLDIVS